MKAGQEWTLPAEMGQLKRGQDGKTLLLSHLSCYVMGYTHVIEQNRKVYRYIILRLLIVI